VASERDEEMPPFVRYGLFTVGVYGVVVTVLVQFSSVEVGGSLLAFTTGFLLFMTVYFAAMWAGWLFFE